MIAHYFWPDNTANIILKCLILHMFL